jgi:hypothetical protein
VCESPAHGERHLCNPPKCREKKSYHLNCQVDSFVLGMNRELRERTMSAKRGFLLLFCVNYMICPIF